MQKCQECSKEFEWKRIVVSLIGGYKPMKCNRCGSVHDISFKSRIGIVLFAVIMPILLRSTGMMIQLEPWIVVSVLLVWFAAVMAIAQFFTDYILRE